MRRLPACLLLLCAITGCLDRSRFNAPCGWSEPAASPLHLTQGSAIRHLRHDGLLAEELGIRRSDSVQPAIYNATVDRIRSACTDSLFVVIADAHGVRPQDVRAATLTRDLYIDALVVWLPVTLLFLFGSSQVADRVRRSYLEHGRVMAVAVTALTSVLAAVVILVIGGQWAWLVEMVRLGDGHISYRAGRLPGIHHRLHILAAATALFWLVAWRRWRSAPD